MLCAQATDALSGAKLTSATFTAPASPEAFTTFLLGTKAFGYTLVPEIDAPEFGPCRPGTRGSVALAHFLHFLHFPLSFSCFLAASLTLTLTPSSN